MCLALISCCRLCAMSIRRCCVCSILADHSDKGISLFSIASLGKNIPRSKLIVLPYNKAEGLTPILSCTVKFKILDTSGGRIDQSTLVPTENTRALKCRKASLLARSTIAFLLSNML